MGGDKKCKKPATKGANTELTKKLHNARASKDNMHRATKEMHSKRHEANNKSHELKAKENRAKKSRRKSLNATREMSVKWYHGRNKTHEIASKVSHERHKLHKVQRKINSKKKTTKLTTNDTKNVDKRLKEAHTKLITKFDKMQKRQTRASKAHAIANKTEKGAKEKALREDADEQSAGKSMKVEKRAKGLIKKQIANKKDMEEHIFKADEFKATKLRAMRKQQRIKEDLERGRKAAHDNLEAMKVLDKKAVEIRGNLQKNVDKGNVNYVRKEVAAMDKADDRKKKEKNAKADKDAKHKKTLA